MVGWAHTQLRNAAPRPDGGARPYAGPSARRPWVANREGGRVSIPRRTAPSHPALVQHAEDRAQNVQDRIADTITRFAGSMIFVYVHVIWFGAWILFKVEHYPFGLLTMIVSLEAIFLSTFVMISQNRADEKRRLLADHQWEIVQEEEQQNEQLLHISNQILELTRAIHAVTAERQPRS
jgi:uncharacterized membrane protein